MTKLRSWSGWLADREIWPLAVGVALATFTTRWAPWGLGLIGVLWLVRWMGRGHLTVRTVLDWPVCLLLLMIPVTFYATTDSQATFAGISRLVAGLALAYGLANWARSGAHVALLSLGFTVVGLVLALVAPVSVGWFSSVKTLLIPARVYEIMPTLVSDTIHPNMLAGALVLLLPFPLAAIFLTAGDALPAAAGVVPRAAARLLDAHWFRRLCYGAAALLMLGVLVLTKSRGGWLAGATVLFVVLVRRWRVLLGLVPLALLGVGLLGWRGELPALLDSISSSGVISGWAGRLEVWSRAIYMIQDFPFTGIGAGTFKPVANTLYPFFLAGPDADIPHAHNLLLQVAVDLGLPGLVAFVAIQLLAVWCALDSTRFYSRVGDDGMAAVAWAGLASLAGMQVHGLVDAATWSIGRGAFVPWAVIGVLVALARRPAPSVAPASERPLPLSGWTRARPILASLAMLLLAGVILGGVALVLREAGMAPVERATIRLPLHPDAQNVQIGSEAPLEGSGWVGQLEVATFSTTHPITGVVTFYVNALAEGGWEMEMQSGDGASWGGIYTHDGGLAVCLLNAFGIEDEVWVSVICGDKSEPVDLPPLPTSVRSEE